jgi:hypothetical protein
MQIDVRFVVLSPPATFCFSFLARPFAIYNMIRPLFFFNTLIDRHLHCLTSLNDLFCIAFQTPPEKALTTLAALRRSKSDIISRASVSVCP